MSNWIEIKDAEDVNADNAWHDVHILYGSDDFGNNYITVPVKFIIKALTEVGYKITEPAD